MNETPSLDDLALFAAVARAGSLSAAARDVSMPLPTLSRRMARLEQQTGRALFLRGKAGYALTAQGRALAAELSPLTDLSHRLARWQDRGRGPQPVRITAGLWTSRHLARTLAPGPGAGWVPAFLPSDAPLDLARREADIGLRNRPPDHPWLARQRLRRVDFAIYGVHGAPPGFITLPETVPLTPSQRWVHLHHGGDIATTATDPRLCLDLALAGAGRMVLPVFVGGQEPGLTPLSDPIPDLAHDAWLVSHHDARHDPPIRAALTAIAAGLG